jgi:hypothetical protein
MNNKQKFKMPLGLGGPSIIMIFIILCLITLGSLALLTANNDWQLTQKTAQSVSAYYEADNKAEEQLADIEAKLKSGRPLAQNTYHIDASDNQELLLVVDNQGGNYQVVCRKLVLKSQWDYDDYKIEFDSTPVEVE